MQYSLTELLLWLWFLCLITGCLNSDSVYWVHLDVKVTSEFLFTVVLIVCLKTHVSWIREQPFEGIDMIHLLNMSAVLHF